MMNIVVVNDDGWGTAGIRLLAKEMTRLGKVTVIAPDGPRSGRGASISVESSTYNTTKEADGLSPFGGS